LGLQLLRSTKLGRTLDPGEFFKHHPSFAGRCERSSHGHRVPPVMDSCHFEMLRSKDKDNEQLCAVIESVTKQNETVTRTNAWLTNPLAGPKPDPNTSREATASEHMRRDVRDITPEDEDAPGIGEERPSSPSSVQPEAGPTDQQTNDPLAAREEAKTEV
jgi:hypothetical protein